MSSRLGAWITKNLGRAKGRCLNVDNGYFKEKPRTLPARGNFSGTWTWRDSTPGDDLGSIPIDPQVGGNMLTNETVITFLTASVILALAPGPDNIFVLTQSALRGRSAGVAVVFGLCTGLIVHSTAVAFGVAVIFQTSAFAFSLLKYMGAGYLVYLAWQAFRTSSEKIQNKPQGAANHWKLYCRGIIMNITNPKVSIFFLAFLPQFAEPSRGLLWIQIIMLGGLFILATILVFGAIALLAGTLGHWLNRSDRAQMVLNKFACMVFLGLALKLATTEQ